MSSSERTALLTSCLEEARNEILRRLREKGLPTSVEVQRLVVRDNEAGTGWSSAWETVRVSPLKLSDYQVELRDESVPAQLIGLRDQLTPLAQFLDATTELGAKRPMGLWPNETGPNGVLLRVCIPLALTYVGGLRDVRRRSDTALAKLDHELAALCDGDRVVRTRQLALSGLQVKRRLGPYKGVTLRPLTPAERGAFLEDESTSWGRAATTPGLVVPRKHSIFSPTALLEIRTERQRGAPRDSSQLPNRLALALFLGEFSIASPGLIVAWDEPRWASAGMTLSPFPVADRQDETRPITKGAFERVVDLALDMPDFSGLEGSRIEIALYRVLRGCGSEDSGFLDFAIALEAALVGGSTAELAYRFRLNGALFLRDERDPKQTFEALRNIYTVRSKLVHGSAVKPAARVAAETDAAELAVAVARKAIETGWPDEEALRDVAFS